MSDHVQRPAGGTPFVQNLTFPVISAGFGTAASDAIAPGGQYGDERVIQWLVFVGASPVTLHFVDSDNGETPGVVVPALAQLTLLLCGIKALRFRSSSLAATVGVIAIPQVYTAASLDALMAVFASTDAEMLSVGTP